MRPEDVYATAKEAGLTLEQAVAATDKVVAALQHVQTRKVADGLVSRMLMPGLDAAHAVGMTAVLGAPFLSYQAGKFLARNTDDSSTNVKDLQETELMSELQDSINKLKEQRKLKSQGLLTVAPK